MSVSATLVVPPLLKHVSGPLLGPAMLAAAGTRAGHHVEVLDTNAQWLRDHAPLVFAPAPRRFVGDHDRPSDLLRLAQQHFDDLVLDAIGPIHGVASLACAHADVHEAARRMAASELGDWLRSLLISRPPPDVLGVSVMYAGQVLPGLAATLVARDLWPDTLVVWGGAHVTALRGPIATDASFGRYVDRFVFGYAEQTWVELLAAVDDGSELPPEVVGAGTSVAPTARDNATVTPQFSIAAGEFPRITLPAQASRGCAYGRCAFCTYPAIEGEYRPLDTAPLHAVVDRAAALRAAVSFKDSLVVPGRLLELAEIVGGRVDWSACTKLHPALNADLLCALREAGLRTLEIGLETLSAEAQRLVGKRQPERLLTQLLDGAATAGIAVVVNYMVGFPGIDVAEQERWRRHVELELSGRPSLVAKLEVNEFQLERLSPMGVNPGAYGIAVKHEWPWSSILDWEATPSGEPNLPDVPAP